MMANDNNQTQSPAALISYAFPVCASYFLLNPTWTVLPGMYSKYFGLELALVATVALYSKMVDALSDPIIGYLSDRHRAKGGSRKTWVVGGGLLTVISAYFLYVPPDNVSFQYYLVWCVLFYLSFTIMEIPHSAWGGELSYDYHQRSRIYSYRILLMNIGQSLFFLLPFILIGSGNEYNPQTLQYAVLYALPIMLLALLLAVLKASPGKPRPKKNMDSLGLLIRSVFGNTALMIFITAYTLIGLAFGMWSGLLYFYLDGYLGLKDKVATVFLFGNLIGLLSIPLWLFIVRRLQKHHLWCGAMSCYALLLILSFSLGQSVAWWWVVLMTGGVFACFACSNIVASSMLSDIADYGAFKFFADRGSIYFALLTLCMKVTIGIGSGLALVLVDYFGYQPQQAEQSEQAIANFQYGFSLLPAIIVMVAIAVAFFSPITQSRHAVIQKVLHSRRHRQQDNEKRSMALTAS